MVLPENDEITVIVVYSIRYDNGKVAQGWFTPDPARQFNNPYLAMGNNPVMYVDPDGEWVHIVIGAVIGGTANVIMQAMKPGDLSWGDGFKAFGVGAAAGAIGAATGGAAFMYAGGAAAGAGGFAAGFAGGAVGAAFSAPVQSIGNNIAFGDPMMTAGEYGLAIVAGGVLGGTVNGISAMAHGKTFWSGSMTGPQGNFPMPGPTGGFNSNGDLKAPNPSNNRSYTRIGDGHEITIEPATFNWKGENLQYGQTSTFRTIANPSAQSFRSFTYGNFRTNLSRYTGNTPSKSHAHHIFPEEFADDFSRLGIQHNNPRYGAWWESHSHLSNAKPYNQQWREFLLTNPNTEQTLHFGRRIMQDYGFQVNF